MEKELHTILDAAESSHASKEIAETAGHLKHFRVRAAQLQQEGLPVPRHAHDRHDALRELFRNGG